MKDKYPKERHNHPQFQQEKQDNCEGNSSLLNQNAILNSKSNIHNVSFDFTENGSKNAKERCFICDYCSKKCSKKTHFINHIRTHKKDLITVNIVLSHFHIKISYFIIFERIQKKNHLNVHIVQNHFHKNLT